MAKRRRRGPGEGSIFRRRDGRWVAEVFLGYGPDGKRRIARAYAKTHNEARIKLKELIEKRDDTLLLREDDKQTTRQFLDRWLHDSASMTLRPSSIQTYANVIKHINSVIGDVELRKLTPQHIQRLYRVKRDQGFRRTLVMMHAVLHRALGQAVKWGLIPKNVVEMVDRPRLPEKEQRALRADELLKLFEVAKADRLYALYVLTATCGLRMGEVLGLKWEDIDLENQTMVIQRQLQWIKGAPQFWEPKTNRGKRTVVLPEIAARALREHWQRQKAERLLAGRDWKDHGLVFTTHIGTPLSPSNVRNRYFYRLLERAGLPRIRFHDLRHTTATLLLEQGVHPRLVQELLGHSQISMTLDVYSHVTAPMLRRVAGAMDAILARAAGRKEGSG